MKQTKHITIELIDTDDLDKDNFYYLYEVNTGLDHFYYATSDEELKDKGIEQFEPKNLIQRADMTEKEWNIAKVLFDFLWTSSNGTNTCMDYEQLEEEEITKEDVETFIEKFKLNDALETYEEDGVEIYWEFLCSFDLNTCDFFE